ncbi:hypothetical protein [Cognatishimia sp. MH4019]|uniref:hypothetical protein n=1 Tax=Cognatishimia sp. MH4019 TaxID=2854030 RepID=UPI001CD6DDAB|nr:hypothetical protein [Cognatishimia sp. MH4019]
METEHLDIVAEYLRLTREVLPQMARDNARGWPVVNDHCFQRIVLDHVCGGTWYDHLERPAYKHLTPAQAIQAVRLAEEIAQGRADLHEMNRQSLIWRGKLR